MLENYDGGETTSKSLVSDTSEVQYKVPFAEAALRYLKGFSLSGRSSRSEFWWAILFSYVLDGGVETIIGDHKLYLPFVITLIVLDVCLWWRRMHDLGKSGWWSLMPFYNLYLATRQSEFKENQYGPVPNTEPVTNTSIHAKVVLGGFIVLLILFIIGWGEPGGVPVSQFKQKEIAEISSGVSSWVQDRNKLVEYVENKHGTVTVKRVELVYYDVRTIDGGDIVYGGGSNIAEREMHLCFLWDGILHKDGRTVIGLKLDKDGNPTKTWTVSTDALIDFEDQKLWEDIGGAIGTFLAL